MRLGGEKDCSGALDNAFFHSFKKPQKITHYALTNDNTASWEDLLKGAASSQYGAYIDYYIIYSEPN